VENYLQNKKKFSKKRKSKTEGQSNSQIGLDDEFEELKEEIEEDLSESEDEFSKIRRKRLAIERRLHLTKERPITHTCNSR
jgi:hypothetical protein